MRWERPLYLRLKPSAARRVGASGFPLPDYAFGLRGRHVEHGRGQLARRQGRFDFARISNPVIPAFAG